MSWDKTLTPGQDVVIGHLRSSSSGAAARTWRNSKNGRRRRFGELVRPCREPTRPVCMRRVVRPKELSCGAIQVAEVFCPGRPAASCSLFDLLSPPEKWLESQRTFRTSQVVGDTGGAKANGCDREFATVVAVSGGTFEIWRLDRGAGTGHVAQDEPSSSLCELTSK